jgi:hypothetical protein
LQWLKKIFKEIRKVGIYNWIGLFSLAVGIIGILITIKIAEETDATIQITDWKGQEQNWIIEQIQLHNAEIEILGTKYTPTIKGEIKIINIPTKYRDKKVDVVFRSDNAKLKGDSVITLHCDKKEKSKLRIYVEGFDKIHGHIKKENTDIGIDSALVSINGNKDLFTYTNKFGYFYLSIPFEYQDVEQIIIIQKENYKSEEKTIITEQLLSKKDIDIYLRPQK